MALATDQQIHSCGILSHRVSNLKYPCGGLGNGPVYAQAHNDFRTPPELLTFGITSLRALPCSGWQIISKWLQLATFQMVLAGLQGNVPLLLPPVLAVYLLPLFPFQLSGGDFGLVKGQCSIRAAAPPKSDRACRSPQEPSCVCSGIRGLSCRYVTSSKLRLPSEMSFFFERNAIHLSQGFVVCPLGCTREEKMFTQERKQNHQNSLTSYFLLVSLLGFLLNTIEDSGGP